MDCISVSYKKAPLSIRQKFAFSVEEQRCFLLKLQQDKKIEGGVIVSTCNRSEIYAAGGEDIFYLLERALAEEKELTTEDIKEYCLYYSGKKAVKHLYRVVCGLDSMIIGEDEILHQVKEAYQNAAGNHLVNGELHMIFQGAFHCAKQSKSSTRLSTTPVSFGTLAANEIEDYLEERRSFLKKDGRHEMAGREKDRISGRVLVIGATGKIGSIVAKDLLAKGISVVGIQRRKHQRDEILSFGCQREGMTFIDYEKRYHILPEVDAIVSATTSPHYTMTKGEYAKWNHGKGHLFIDLAVPCDIDREIAEIEGVTLYNIDYFKLRVEQNYHIKRSEADKAEEILKICVEEVMKNLYVKQFYEQNTKQREEWFPKMVYYLKEILDSDEFLRVLEKIER